MATATLIILLALLQYTWFIALVGAARGKYDIKAPACSGHPVFERTLRVQENTLEQLILFIPSTYAFAMFVSVRWVWVPGVMYLLGRFLYARAYIADPGTRTIGMVLTLAASVLMILATLVFLGLAQLR